MKAVAARYLALTLLVGVSPIAASQDLSGLWKLSIRNLDHAEVSVLTIRFTDKPGQSCIVGDWKQIVVQATKTSDPGFFPVADALTYQVRGSELLIGRNGVCDAYLRLKGKFDGRAAEGRYYAFGLRGLTDGPKYLGEFSLSRDR